MIVQKGYQKHLPKTFGTKLICEMGTGLGAWGNGQDKHGAIHT
jgi:hypothetical protein